MDQSHGLGRWTMSTEDLFQSSFPMHRACRDGDMDSLASLLKVKNGYLDFYEEDDFYGWTPVHWASYFGKLPCLMRLLEAGSSCDNPTERLNQSPAHIAAYGGQSHCLKWLLHCGASLCRQDYLGETPCHKAARTGSMECVSLLVSQGARLNVRNNSGLTPSQVAASAGFSECANYLERAMQIQLQASDVYDEMRTPVTHPTTSLANPLSNPIVSERSSSNECQSSSVGQALISVNRYHSTPHYIPNGTTLGSPSHGIVNGLVHNNNYQSEDCDMEMESEAQEGNFNMNCNGAMEADATRNGPFNTVTWGNGGHIAGKKRGLEGGEEECFKRARSEEPSMSKNKLSGWLHNNGHMANHMTQNTMPPITESMLEHYRSLSVQQGYDNMVLDSVMNK